MLQKKKYTDTMETYNIRNIQILLSFIEPDIEKSGLESKLGAYDKVTEFDFVLLYPNIVLKKNISSDTIN